MYGDYNRSELIGEKYLVLGMLGEGAFANVYRVSDQHINKEYAMKVLSKEGKDTTREIQVLQRLEHKGLPALHDVMVKNGKVYVVMELAKGITLKEYVKKRGKLSVKEAMRIAKKLCEIIAYLHGQLQPIVHGDLKPQNIMVGDGEVCLIDFGGAFIQQDVTGGIYGTPGYAAPELRQGEISAQSDIYSFGKVLEFMLTGREAFDHEAVSGKRELKKYGVPAGVRNIITKCTMEEERLRYQSGKELSEALTKNKKEMIYLPGHAIYFLAGIIRGIGGAIYIGCLFFYKVQLQVNLPELFLVGGMILLMGLFLDRVSQRFYKTAILECECSIIVSQWNEGAKSFL